MKLQSYFSTFSRRTAFRGLTWLLLVLALLLPQQMVEADTTLVVDTTTDSDSLIFENCSPFLLNDCSLRGAINRANTLSGTDTITFDSSVFSTPQTITLNSALPQVTSAIIIDGPGASLLTVDGADTYRVFYADTGADLTLDNLTVANGSAPNGAGVYVNGATLTVTNTTFSGNHASNRGGAIYNISAGTVTVTNTTFSGNIADNGGAAIITTAKISGPRDGPVTVTSSTFIDNSSNGDGGAIMLLTGTLSLTDSTISNSTAVYGGAIYSQVPLTITNSTLSGNTASYGGGIMNYFGDTTITNSTLSGNSANSNQGGGVYTNGGTLNLNNSLIANSTNGGDCYRDGGTINAQNSLIEDGLTCVNGTNTNNLTGDPSLGALANNGGSTQTMALQVGSPAINAGDNALAVDENDTALAYDQRGSGYPRIFGSIVDMGAYEATYTYDFVVDTTSDADLQGCSPAPNDCSLRGAINLANAISGTDTLTFDSTVFSTAQTITLSSALPPITSTIIIDGPGSSLLTVDGASAYRVFYTDTGADLTLDSLTIANGRSTYGAAVNNNGGTVTVSDSVFTGNLATNTGGAIYVAGGTLMLSNTTLSGNSANSNGGGLGTSGGTVTLTDCTFSNNQATNTGGAVISHFTNMTVTGCTFDSNSSPNGGGINNDGTLTLINSTYERHHLKDSDVSRLTQ